MDTRPFGEWVKDHRQRLGLSRTDLAGLVGVTHEYVRMIELGLRNPSTPLRISLVVCLNDEESLSDVIFKSLENVKGTRQEVADLLADRIITAGYRKALV